MHRLWLRNTSVTPPDGESFDRVADRVQRARARIISEYGGETVLVVSHVTPIKTLLRIALDAGPGILYRLHLDLASLSHCGVLSGRRGVGATGESDGVPGLIARWFTTGGVPDQVNDPAVIDDGLVVASKTKFFQDPQRRFVPCPHG